MKKTLFLLLCTPGKADVVLNAARADRRFSPCSKSVHLLRQVGW